MPTSADVLTNFRDHLVAQGIVRKEGQGGPLPPMYIEIEDGSLSPGDEELAAAERNSEIIATASFAGEWTPREGEGSILTTTIDVRYRTVKDRSWRAMELHALVRDQVLETPYGYREAWMMAALHVINSQPTGFSPIGRARGEGYEHLGKYLFQVYAAP